MICPRCNNNLILSNTQGVEIDYCPNCKGVWLDRGELEKIIERSNSYESSYKNSEHNDHHENHYDKHYDNQNVYGHDRKNKKGFLSELFDF